MIDKTRVLYSKNVKKVAQASGQGWAEAEERSIFAPVDCDVLHFYIFK